MIKVTIKNPIFDTTIRYTETDQNVKIVQIDKITNIKTKIILDKTELEKLLRVCN